MALLASSAATAQEVPGLNRQYRCEMHDNFAPLGSELVQQMAVQAGFGCPVSFVINGLTVRSTPTVVESPRRGSLAVKGRAAFVYTARKGPGGTDRFRVRFDIYDRFGKPSTMFWKVDVVVVP